MGGRALTFPSPRLRIQTPRHSIRNVRGARPGGEPGLGQQGRKSTVASWPLLSVNAARPRKALPAFLDSQPLLPKVWSFHAEK